MLNDASVLDDVFNLLDVFCSPRLCPLKSDQ